MSGVSFWQHFLTDDNWQILLAMLAGYAAAAPLVGWFCRQSGKRKLKKARWYSDALLCIQFCCLMIASVISRRRIAASFNPFVDPSVVMFGLAIVFLLLRTAWRFWKNRVQYSLASLCLLMLAVALICSAGSYVPVVPLIMFLTCPAIEWARYAPAGTVDQSELAPQGKSPPDAASRSIWLVLLTSGGGLFAALCLVGFMVLLLEYSASGFVVATISCAAAFLLAVLFCTSPYFDNYRRRVWARLKPHGPVARREVAENKTTDSPESVE